MDEANLTALREDIVVSLVRAGIWRDDSLGRILDLLDTYVAVSVLVALEGPDDVPF